MNWVQRFTANLFDVIVMFLMLTVVLGTIGGLAVGAEKLIGISGAPNLVAYIVVVVLTALVIAAMYTWKEGRRG